MKTTLLTLLLSVAAFAADSGPLGSTLEAWKQAVLKKDAASLQKMYHADLTYTHSSAMTETKAEAIAAVAKGSTKAIEYRDITTKIYGKTAIMKGKFDITNDQNSTSHLVILMVWEKSGSDWQLLARQATKLP